MSTSTDQATTHAARVVSSDAYLAAIEHYRQALDLLGVVGDEHTPARAVRALVEMTGGLDTDPARHLGVTFPPVSAEPGLVSVTRVPFTSICAHHLLPFHGVAAVAYLPKPFGDIVGLSKLHRLLDGYARRPQVQERIGAQVVQALMSHSKAAGAAVALRGVHSCMALRGTRTGPDAAMVTIETAGELRNDPWHGQFMAVAAGVIG